MAASKAMNVTIPESDINLEDLEDIERTEERTDKRPNQLPLESIHVASDAFQPRLVDEDRRASEDHIRDLARALEQGDDLPPLLITPVGQKFFLVDGHHRLGAYMAVEWNKSIPVAIFEGSVREAHDASLEQNNKNKLPMTSASRNEKAWQLVQAGNKRYSKARIAKLTGVSDRTIATMRKVWKEHRQKVEGRLWSQVRGLQFQTDQEAEADWREQKVEQIAERMRKSGLGGELLKRPDIFADAIALVDPQMPERLCEHWVEVAKEVLERSEEAEGLDI
jgi:hypothetical protein